MHVPLDISGSLPINGRLANLIGLEQRDGLLKNPKFFHSEPREESVLLLFSNTQIEERFLAWLGMTE